MILRSEVEAVALLGWHLYPAGRSASKAACFKGASAAATCDLDTLARWSDEYPNCNWRVVCGPSNIWGIDIDAPGQDHAADGISAFAELAKAYPPLPGGPRTRSGGGGLALFFQGTDQPISGRTGYPAPGIDPRRGKLSVTIPPSIHHRTRRPYRWIIAPWEVAPPPAPDWLLRLFKPPPEPEFNRNPNIVDDSRARRSLIRAMQAIRDAPSGSANTTLNRRAFYIARCVAGGALNESEAIEGIYCAAQNRGIPLREIIDTVKSAWRGGFAKPLERV